MKSALSIDDGQQRTGNQACSSRARVDEVVAPSGGFVAAVHESVAGTQRPVFKPLACMAVILG